MHITHNSVHVSETGCVCNHFTVAQKRSSKLRWCMHRHLRAKPAALSTLLCRARPVCASVLPQHTSTGALGQGAALGEMPEELLSVLSLRL